MILVSVIVLLVGLVVAGIAAAGAPLGDEDEEGFHDRGD